MAATGAGEGIRTLDPNLGKVPQRLRCNIRNHDKALYFNSYVWVSFDMVRHSDPVFPSTCLHIAYMDAMIQPCKQMDGENVKWPN